MKSSTTRKLKKDKTPRLVTRSEMNALSVRVYLTREGWGVRDIDGIRSIHRTQAEAIEKGRAIARKLSGCLAIYDRKDHVRKWEVFWSGSVAIKSEPARPEFRPVNATRKQMREAMKAVIRERRAREAQTH